MNIGITMTLAVFFLGIWVTALFLAGAALTDKEQKERTIKKVDVIDYDGGGNFTR